MIRLMTAADRDEILSMMRVFYASDAVLSNGSEKIFANDFESCVGECPYIEGYVFQDGVDIQGYAMAAKGFSTEFGKPCVWVEDLYIKKEYRGQGIGSGFLEFIGEKYPDAVIRLEAETENAGAVKVYKKQGFTVLPYLEMINKQEK